MDGISVIARVVLAVVFASAAAAKARDHEGTRSAVEAFRAPGWAAGPTAVLLPLTEAVVVVLALLAPTARLGGGLAVALLAVFTGAIVAALRRGEAPDCHCFGQSASGPVGPATLLRNGLLMTVGLTIATVRAPALTQWASDTAAVQVISAGVLALAAAAALTRMGSAKGLGRADRPLALGRRLPPFTLTDVAGRTVTDQDFGHGQMGLIAFISPDCVPCQDLMPELAEWQASAADRLHVRVLASGAPDVLQALASQYKVPGLVADAGAVTARRLRVHGTPSAILVDGRGRVASAPAGGPQAIEALMRAALGAGPRGARGAQR